MKIKQEKEFKPLTITLETKEEYDSFFKIVNEAVNVHSGEAGYMEKDDYELARQLSNFDTNNL